MNAIPHLFNRIHPAGQPFVIGAAALALVFFLLSWTWLAWLMVLVTAFVIYFFRDPVRVTPDLPDALISPADGFVAKIEKAVPPPELEMGDSPRTRISIFLTVVNVHVNRVPASGTITKLVYVPGLFVNASLDKASEDNERQLVRMTTSDGKDIAFVQIAGLIARRIVCQISEADEVAAGQRFGLIRFGSRMDVYLDGHVPAVVLGQSVVAGETVIADGRKSAPEALRDAD